jgi:cAMP-specific phosphodiesterase 4
VQPLEQHHAATAMLIMKEEENNLLVNLSKEDFTIFRKVFVENIMYTDIKVHFDLLKDFEARFKESKQESMKKFGTNVPIILGEGEEDIKMLTGMIVHTADFNGGAKMFDVSRVWSERVNVEF